jgi:hypothetical protein
MKRSLRIFALLTAASMLIWIAGCGGDDEEEEKGPPPEVSAISVAEGAELAGNTAITVSFSKAMESVDIAVSGATGTVSVVGKAATWTPSPDIPAGAHTLTGSGTDKEGQTVDFGPVNFTAIAPDTTAPEIVDNKCDPKNGATGVDPADYPETLIIVFSEAMAEAKVTATDPEFDQVAELSADTLTITLMKYSMPNETEFTITVEGTDLAGNDLATTEYSFTTMAKEE